ncbi:hypothetical protein RUMGNA_02932 [Mediterraneibacter gnavus ATCC 29149]|uniref:Uncharacterized protein n=1 Tax=Mediterraneibacter gnavus (strain ATCC 29149 / DSM 114966 / JCM 6515 / VPI C7-9) TaxID=411470 RepID=A7B5T6_MEDG7|nr:hypothetical protein RUMGNA_02932 [Mediterraneibacter gnavus ATCC 29149]
MYKFLSPFLFLLYLSKLVHLTYLLAKLAKRDAAEQRRTHPLSWLLYFIISVIFCV